MCLTFVTISLIWWGRVRNSSQSTFLKQWNRIKRGIFLINLHCWKIVGNQVSHTVSGTRASSLVYVILIRVVPLNPSVKSRWSKVFSRRSIQLKGHHRGRWYLLVKKVIDNRQEGLFRFCKRMWVLSKSYRRQNAKETKLYNWSTNHSAIQVCPWPINCKAILSTLKLSNRYNQFMFNNPANLLTSIFCWNWRI